MNFLFNHSFTPARLCIVFTAAVLAGCATHYSFFKPSQDISRVFENGEVLPEYRYYVGGPKVKPNAIVAIHTDFTLKSEHWSPITVTPESLRKLVEKIGFVSYAQQKADVIPNGAQIILATGEVVGIWYSVYQYSQVRRLEKSGVYLSYPQSQLPSNVAIPKRS